MEDCKFFAHWGKQTLRFALLFWVGARWNGFGYCIVQVRGVTIGFNHRNKRNDVWLGLNLQPQMILQCSAFLNTFL